MAEIFIAPSEPKSIKEIGEVSSYPETLGADILFLGVGGWFGVQRKEYRDLVASTRDGRLRKEIAQLQSCWKRALIVEGNPIFNSDGQLQDQLKWTLQSHYSLLSSVQDAGVWVFECKTMADTIARVHNLSTWAVKEKHTTLRTSPNPTSPWGDVTSEDWSIHLIQAMGEGIGYQVAKNIYDHFKGVPIQWLTDEKELATIPLVGKKRARTLIAALGPVPSAGNQE